jgi:hypothetical protein
MKAEENGRGDLANNEKYLLVIYEKIRRFKHRSIIAFWSPVRGDLWA